MSLHEPTTRDDDPTAPATGSAADASATGTVGTASAASTAGTPAPRRSWKRPFVAAAATVVLAGAAVGGTLVSMTKSVTVTVDGQTTQVSTLSGSVAGALEAAGVTAGDHDVLAPAADAAITDGSQISLNRGRLLTLTVDGQSREVWTTARTVDEALAQLGQDSADYALSADRGRDIPLEGFALDAATLHTATVTDGTGEAVTVATPATTVADLLTAQGITLNDQDTVTPALDTPVTDGTAVAVTRTVVSTVVEDEQIPQPADVTVEDPNLDRGTTAVTVQGAPGTAAVSYQVTTVNGRQTARTEVGRTTTVEPVAGQIAVGTRTSLTWVGNQVFFNDTEFGVNWDGLAFCESTHNPKAVNAYPSRGLPTYGLFQFDLPTWQSVGGSGNPVDATPEEQIMRAKLLFQSRGLEPWACREAAK
ncbi:resuscitation-promoting factor [Nakamurella deserti]|uniref:resuscitation-promoting factor n=1 Tax=Nakamurella deserti TaxID=2164074 RepID=UPI000DBE4F2E|nr:resuscitation-promoting factor [Nakamurella deserti]